jgi:hypothetical protein
VGSSRISNPWPRPTERISSIEVHPVARERFARSSALAAPRDAEARARRSDIGHSQVLEHAERVDEPEILVHEAHAELAELPDRERQPHGLAVDPELTGLRLVEPGEHLDQRRLARAVLPEEAVDLPGEHVQVDAAQRLRPAEALRQAVEGQARMLRGVAHRYFRPQSFW